MNDGRRWESLGGRARLELDIADLAAYGFRAVWRRGDSELILCLEVPYHKFGLPIESAHALRLGEAGCTVVVKVRIPDTDDNAVDPLVTTFISGKRRLIVPKATFTVSKSSTAGLQAMLDANREDEETASVAAGFGVKDSMEDSLNTLFPRMLAVESNVHLPEPVAAHLSLAYVRELRRTGAPEVDSEDYAADKHSTLRGTAMQVRRSACRPPKPLQ